MLLNIPFIACVFLLSHSNVFAFKEGFDIEEPISVPENNFYECSAFTDTLKQTILNTYKAKKIMIGQSAVVHSHLTCDDYYCYLIDDLIVDRILCIESDRYENMMIRILDFVDSPKKDFEYLLYYHLKVLNLSNYYDQFRKNKNIERITEWFISGKLQQYSITHLIDDIEFEAHSILPISWLPPEHDPRFTHESSLTSFMLNSAVREELNIQEGFDVDTIIHIPAQNEKFHTLPAFQITLRDAILNLRSPHPLDTQKYKCVVDWIFNSFTSPAKGFHFLLDCHLQALGFSQEQRGSIQRSYYVTKLSDTIKVFRQYFDKSKIDFIYILEKAQTELKSQKRRGFKISDPPPLYKQNPPSYESINHAQNESQSHQSESIILDPPPYNASQHNPPSYESLISRQENPELHEQHDTLYQHDSDSGFKEGFDIEQPITFSYIKKFPISHTKTCTTTLRQLILETNVAKHIMEGVPYKGRYEKEEYKYKKAMSVILNLIVSKEKAADFLLRYHLHVLGLSIWYNKMKIYSYKDYNSTTYWTLGNDFLGTISLWFYKWTDRPVLSIDTLKNFGRIGYITEHNPDFSFHDTGKPFIIRYNTRIYKTTLRDAILFNFRNQNGGNKALHAKIIYEALCLITSPERDLQILLDEHCNILNFSNNKRQDLQNSDDMKELLERLKDIFDGHDLHSLQPNDFEMLDRTAKNFVKIIYEYDIQ